jgi:hypothetical protein
MEVAESNASRRFRSSTAVAVLAFLVWVGSLFFDTYVTYGAKDGDLKGMYVLAFGWLALLGMSVAWLANGCFLIALLRSRAGGAGFAIAAALLSLDALRLNEVPAWGSNRSIYGYGLGFVLWLAAMGFGLVATGMRARERNADPAQTGEAGWARELGLGWLAVLAIGVGALAVKDRTQAASAERDRLRSVVFKRGPVCDQEPPVAPSVKVSPAIVEIAGSAGYPFNEPTGLLGWGVPIVRVREYDYSYIGTGIDRMMKIEAARGSPSAVLHYESEAVREGTASAIRVRLVSDGGADVINQLWTPDGPGYHYCPDYQQSPRANQQPRKVVMEALGLSDRGDLAGPNFWDTVVRVTGKVVGREGIAGAEWINNNAGCPPGIGFSYERASKERIPAQSFFFQDMAFMSAGPGIFSVCTGKSIYIYNSQRSSNDFFLTITRREMKDFSRSWSLNVKLPNADPALQERETRIVAIAEDTGMVRIRTRHYGHDQFLVLEAPLPSTAGMPKGSAK